MLEVCRAQRRPVEFCQNPDRGEKLVCLFPCGAILLLWLAVSSPECFVQPTQQWIQVLEHNCKGGNLNIFLLRWLSLKAFASSYVAQTMTSAYSRGVGFILLCDWSMCCV